MNDNEVSDDVLPTSLSGSDVSDGLDRLMRARITPEMHMQCKVCWFVYDPKRGFPNSASSRALPSTISPRTGPAPSAAIPRRASFRQKASDGRCRKRRIIKTHRASLTRRRPMHFLRCRELPFRLIR